MRRHWVVVLLDDDVTEHAHLQDIAVIITVGYEVDEGEDEEVDEVARARRILARSLRTTAARCQRACSAPWFTMLGSVCTLQ